MLVIIGYIVNITRYLYNIFKRILIKLSAHNMTIKHCYLHANFVEISDFCECTFLQLLILLTCSVPFNRFFLISKFRQAILFTWNC